MGNLARDKNRGRAAGFVLKRMPRRQRCHNFPIVHRDEVAVRFRDAVRTGADKTGSIHLGRFTDLAEHRCWRPGKI